VTAFDQLLTAQAVQAVWAFDEGRFGLKVWLRRRWCPRGVRPPWVVADAYMWVWVYLAVEPLTGACVCLLLPGVDSACLQVFIDVFAAAVTGQRVGVVLDNAGSHQATHLTWPDHLVRLPLPPYSPELNPVERVFQHLRARLANQIFADLPALEAALSAALQQFWHAPPLMQGLTGYPWWLAAAERMTKLAS
jgi:transposase